MVKAILVSVSLAPIEDITYLVACVPDVAPYIKHFYDVRATPLSSKEISEMIEYDSPYDNSGAATCGEYLSDRWVGSFMKGKAQGLPSLVKEVRAVCEMYGYKGDFLVFDARASRSEEDLHIPLRVLSEQEGWPLRVHVRANSTPMSLVVL